MPSTLNAPLVNVVALADITSALVPGWSSLSESGTIHLGPPGSPLPCKATEPFRLDVAAAGVAVLAGVGDAGGVVQVTVDGPEVTFTVPTVVEAVTVSIPATVPAYVN